VRSGISFVFGFILDRINKIDKKLRGIALILKILLILSKDKNGESVQFISHTHSPLLTPHLVPPWWNRSPIVVELESHRGGTGVSSW